MIKFLQGLFQRGAAAPTKEQPAVEYSGFSISPCPRKVAGGWSTEAVIRKVIDGEIKTHTFIRADTSATFDAAIALIISKAKTLIDQRGDTLFNSSRTHQ